MKLFLDDVRDPPDDSWTVARTVEEAKRACINCRILRDHLTYLSLDHDLGGAVGGDAPVFLDWIVEHGLWPTQGIMVHSQNPVGVRNLLRTIDRYGPYEHVWFGNQRGEW